MVKKEMKGIGPMTSMRTDAKGEPEPVVKTRKVSELILTHDQMVAAVKEKYPEIGYGVVADAVYGCGRLSVMKFTWSEPAEPSSKTINVNGGLKVVMTEWLSYSDIVALALGKVVDPLPILSVTYKSKAGEGSILPTGHSVKVYEGMSINAYDTSSA